MERDGAAHARRDIYGTARAAPESTEWPGGGHQVVGRMFRALVLILYLNGKYILLNWFGERYGYYREMFQIGIGQAADKPVTIA